MAITTTLAEVKLIIVLDENIADPNWQAMLDDATAWITALDIETDCGTATANAVTKYVAAHFMTMQDPRQVEQKIDDASEKFSDTYDLGLDSSHYGQMAKRLDCSGKLNKADVLAKSDKVKPTHIFSVSGR